MTTSITIRTATVHPSDLEVSWDTGEHGMYHWVQVKHDGTLNLEEVTTAQRDTYTAGLQHVRDVLRFQQAELDTGRAREVLVAQANVTDKDGMSFIATTMAPAEDTLSVIESTLSGMR